LGGGTPFEFPKEREKGAIYLSIDPYWGDNASAKVLGTWISKERKGLGLRSKSGKGGIGRGEVAAHGAGFR